MAAAALEPKDPDLNAFVSTVKGLVLEDPFPEHPETEFIHVRQPFHNEDVYEHLTETLGTAQHGSDEGLHWVSEELEDRTTTKCLLVGYVYQRRTQIGYPGIVPWEFCGLPPGKGRLCSPQPDFSKFLYVVSPILPIYQTSDSIAPFNIHLYAIVVESRIGRPFRVRHDFVFFRHEYRTHGILREERPWAWLRNVGDFCKDLAAVNPAQNIDATMNPAQNINALIDPASDIDDESKAPVHYLDEPIKLGGSNDTNHSSQANEFSKCGESSDAWDSTYRGESPEENDGSSASSEHMRQVGEDESMGTIPTCIKQESSPLVSEEPSSAARGDIAMSMEEEVIASEITLVNRWIKRVRKTTTEIHGSGSPAAREAASQVWANFFQEFKKLSKKSLENLRECATAGSTQDEGKSTFTRDIEGIL